MKKILPILFVLLCFSLPIHAEDNTATLIDGTTSNNASANYTVGNTGTNNSLIITNAGKLVNCALGYVGNAATASNNWALVTGSGSLWTNSSTFYVGKSGPLNQMNVANTGAVKSIGLVIGGAASSFGNVVTVTDTGTVWDLGGVMGTGGNPGSGLAVGYASSLSNTLNIVNGAVVTNLARWDDSTLGGINQSALKMAGNYGTLNITNGGKVYTHATAGNPTIIGGTYNTVNVIGTNSLMNLPGFGLTISGDNDKITVDGGTLVNPTTVALSPGTNIQLLIKNGGQFVTWGSQQGNKLDLSGNGNSVIVTDTGSVCTVDSVGRNDAGGLGGLTGPNASITAANGGVFNSTYATRIGVGAYSNNAVIVTNGGRFIHANSAGYPVYIGSAGAVNNGVLVRDSGYFKGGLSIAGVSNYVSILNNSTLNLAGGGYGYITLGTAAGDFGNRVTVSNNCSVTNFGGTLTIGGSGATNNSLSILNNSVLDMGSQSIAVGGATGYTNTLTVKHGGIVQFTTATPTITITAPANSNAVIFDGGTLAYRGVASVNLTNNWGATGVGTCLWQNVSGANCFRLNNSYATNSLSSPYVFSASLGPTNYGRVDLINGNTALYGNGITSSNDASLLVSNTYAIVQGPLVNYSGNVTIYNAMLECTNLNNQGTIFTNVASGLISGGYQFNTVAPVIVTNGGIALQNGVISYRAVTNADVKANWLGWSGANDTTNITLLGAAGNGFELNAATNTAATDQSYTFSRSLGASNFAWLAIVNNGRWRNGSVTIANDGAMLITNSTPVFEGAVTNLGVANTYNSTVTYQGPYAMTNGAGNQVLNSSVNYNQGITKLGGADSGITNWIVNGNLGGSNYTVNANDLLGFASTNFWGVDTNSSLGFQVLTGGNLWISNAAYTVFTVPLTNAGYTLISPNAVLRVPSIKNTVGAITNNGGFLEFTTNTPTIDNAAGIVVTNGGIGYYGVANADVMANWTGYGNANATKDIVYQGNNLFWLKNAQNTQNVSQSYIFGQGLGATNWAGMVLVGSAAYRTLGGDTVIFTNNASLLMTNATADYYIGNGVSNVTYNLYGTNGGGTVWRLNGITGVGGGGLVVGSGSATGNVLNIQNASLFHSTKGCTIGDGSGANNNTVTISGTGSVWNLGGVNVGGGGGSYIGSGLTIGYTSSLSNTLNIVNGAVVTNLHRRDYPNQAALQTAGSYGTLNITNGGKLYSGGYGTAISGSGNAINVIGTNSLWDNGAIGVSFGGNGSPNNVLTVSDGGVVQNVGNFIIPYAGGGIFSNQQVVVKRSGKMYCSNFQEQNTSYQKYDSVLVTDPGSLLSCSGIFRQGNGAGANGNSLSVVNSASLSVAGALTIAAGANGNTFTVTNAGTVTASGLVNVGAGITNWARVSDTGSVSSAGLTIAGTSNSVSILNNSTWSMGTAALTLGGGAGTVSNTLTIDSSSYVTNAGGFTLNEPGRTFNLINNKFEGVGGPIWFSGGNLSVGTVISSNATLNVSNCVINPAGGNGGTAYIGSSGYGADSNTLNVLAGTVWDVGNQIMYVGSFNNYNWYTKGNVANINGGVVSNASSFKVQGGNSMFNITNNGKAYCTGITLGGNYSGMGTNDILNVSGSGSLLYCGNANTMGVYANSTAILNVFNYGTWINIYGGLEQSGSGQNANVSSGGKVNFDPYRSYNQQNSLTIGRNAGDSDCNVTVTGQDSLWDMGNNQIKIASFAGAGTTCKLTVANNGVISNVTTLSVGTYAGSANNSALATNAGVLDITTGITVGNATGYTNTLTVKQGSILQFTTASPTITITAPANSNAVIFDGGTLAYRGIQSAPYPNLTNNWGTTGVGTCQWQNASGYNTFRLNNAYATNSLGRPYLFTASDGATNYGRFEMVNSTNILYGYGATIDTTGSALISNTTATIYGAFTNNGTIIVNNSSVTFMTNVVIGTGSTMKWTTNAPNQFSTVRGILTLNAMTLDVSSIGSAAIGATVFASSNVIQNTSSVSSWTIIPNTLSATVSGDNKSIILQQVAPMAAGWSEWQPNQCFQLNQAIQEGETAQ